VHMHPASLCGTLLSLRHCSQPYTRSQTRAQTHIITWLSSAAVSQKVSASLGLNRRCMHLWTAQQPGIQISVVQGATTDTLQASPWPLVRCFHRKRNMPSSLWDSQAPLLL
jgi:hypothetical protein